MLHAWDSPPQSILLGAVRSSRQPPLRLLAQRSRGDFAPVRPHARDHVVRNRLEAFMQAVDEFTEGALPSLANPRVVQVFAQRHLDVAGVDLDTRV